MSVTVLGIDTSNYTTSLAVCRDGEIIENIKLPLPVKDGGVGLRQSDAVFAHTVNLPRAYESLKTDLSSVRAVGYSDRPRNVEGSYMPCFLCGEASAVSVGRALNVPVYKSSHQEGHIKAAVYSSKMPDTGRFYAYHLSGGTFELLKVTKNGASYDCEIKGGTLDVTAGQIIDRVGVMLGLPFPCGRRIDELAAGFTGKLPQIKISVNGCGCNLSGVENKAKKLIDGKEPPELVAAYILEYIKRTVAAMTDNTLHDENLPVLFSGGVSSNSMLRKYFTGKYGAYFAEPAFSADNAAGTALITYDRFING
ncbi:MAG: hypothetical protein J5585_02130 [Clostridia bacterium]|nr:hypothetical protein [Clostridia bacterium]